MKNRGQNSPQTLRGLRERRSMRGLLDTRQHQEADISMETMSSPFGKGFHNLKTASGTVYTVADQTGGRTFAPETQVMVAAPDGRIFRAVLGGAPAGKKGGVSRSRSRRSSGSVGGDANQYAFGVDGLGNMLALLYSDGVYLSTRATEVEVSGVYTGCILTDSSLVVGVGSLLMHDGSQLKVWDVEGGTFYSYSIPAGWTNASPLYYQNGFLYWCEFENIPVAGIGVGDPTFDYRLRKSTTDFVTVSTIATVTSANASSYGMPATAYAGPAIPWAFAVDADGAILYMGFEVTEIINNEWNEWHGIQARFALTGGAPDTREFAATEFRDTVYTSPQTVYCATLGSDGFALCAEFNDGHSVMAKSDNASTAAVDLWGVDDFIASGVIPRSFNVGTSGSVLQVYSSDVVTILRGVTGGVVISAAVEAFDATPNYPSAMFYFGE